MNDARPPEIRLGLRSSRRGAGLRVQILLALAGLMLLAFVPLFFAVASLTRATVSEVREQSARSVARSVAYAAHDGATLEAERAAQGADAMVLVDPRTARVVAAAGDPTAVAELSKLAPGVVRGASPASSGGGRAIDVALDEAGVRVAARLRADDTGERAAPLVRLVALYMTIFGIALLTFAYFALTRLIVRPLEALGAATARVATGARTVRMPRAGSLEIAEVSEGVQRMTESLIADEEALRAKVEELTTATERLEHAQAQLVRSERMASVGRLAAGVAHEIGNPIAALLGLEDLLLDGGIDEPTQNDFLGRMKKETLRISGVVRDLLDFARPESATGAPDAEASASADVAEVAADVAALVKPQKEFKGGRATLEVDVPARASVRLSSSRLTQVLLNLVLNAGHAARSRVTVRARPGGNDTIRVEVEDDGPGIPPELVDRVFEPFVTTKQVGEGTGLGLAVCRGLVESAGGTIAVDTRYRDGARLVVTLPRA